MPSSTSVRVFAEEEAHGMVMVDSRTVSLIFGLSHVNTYFLRRGRVLLARVEVLQYGTRQYDSPYIFYIVSFGLCVTFAQSSEKKTD